jgi:hypothetical protein
VDTFIGALKVDHGGQKPRGSAFIERFQKSGGSASKVLGLNTQKRSLKGFGQTQTIL